MKKRGYTLAEALIALTVIGVIAAVTMPLANKFRPDSNKVLYLKTYDAVVQATQEMAFNTQFYPHTNDPQSAEGDLNIYTSIPFYNIQEKTFENQTYGGDVGKYCEILALYFDANSPTCATETADPTENNISFTAKNGVQFWVYTERNDTVGEERYKTDLYFDVDGAQNGKNCMYGDVGCNRPDKFRLSIAADGQIYATDAMGFNYLNTRNNYRQNRGNIAGIDELSEDLFNVRLSKIPETDFVAHGYDRPDDIEKTKPKEIELPDGHVWADWVSPVKLRKTYSRGVYCEEFNDVWGFLKQRHVYWHEEAKRWVELKDVFYVHKDDYNYNPYTGSDANKISNWGGSGW